MFDVRMRRKVQDPEPSESPAQGLITRQAGDCLKLCVSERFQLVRDLESWAGKDHFVTTNVFPMSLLLSSWPVRRWFPLLRVLGSVRLQSHRVRRA